MSAQSSVEAEIFKWIREGSAAVRLTLDGKGGARAIGKAELRASVSNCGSSSSASNQAARVGFATEEGRCISRYLRPFKSGEV